MTLGKILIHNALKMLDLWRFKNPLFITLEKLLIYNALKIVWRTNEQTNRLTNNAVSSVAFATENHILFWFWNAFQTLLWLFSHESNSTDSVVRSSICPSHYFKCIIKRYESSIFKALKIKCSICWRFLVCKVSISNNSN